MSITSLEYTRGVKHARQISRKMGVEQTRQQAAKTFPLLVHSKVYIQSSLEGGNSRRAMIQQKKSGLHEVEIKAVLIKFIDFP